MARPSQTFKKRQRENKLRERAQMKRERREQRGMEKKLLKSADPVDGALLVTRTIGPDQPYRSSGDSNS